MAGMGAKILLLFVTIDAFLVVFGPIGGIGSEPMSKVGYSSGIYSVSTDNITSFPGGVRDPTKVGGVRFDPATWFYNTFLSPGALGGALGTAAITIGTAILFGMSTAQIVAIAMMTIGLASIPISVINAMGLPGEITFIFSAIVSVILVLSFVDFLRGGNL